MLTMFNSKRDFHDSACTVAVLPVGALEQHGSHLPIGSDNIIAGELASRVADRLDAFLLPVIGITSSIEHRKGGGTVYLKADTLGAVIRDIAESLQFSGYKKLIIVNGHGGNWILKPTVRQLNRDFKDMKSAMEVVLIHTTVGLQQQMEVMDHPLHDIHAGENETSLILHLCGEHVKEIVPQQALTTAPQEYMDYFDVTEITEDGYWGSPEAANEKKGKQILEIIVEAAMNYLEQLETTKNRINGKSQ